MAPIIFDNTPLDGSRSNPGSTYPIHAIATNEATQRVEPMLTPELLRSRFLFGIPLVSYLTKETVSDEMLKDHIVRAMNEAELQAKIQISPVQFSEKLQFDRNLYQQWVHLNASRYPIASLQSLTITTADQTNVFVMPQRWIETNGFYRGLINVIPISPAFASIGSSTSAATGGAVFLTFIGQLGFIPAYWQIKYMAGFEDKSIPVVVNELIGCIAAMNVLTLLGATKQITSHALGADGLTQSVGGPGPQTFVQRMQELEAKRQQLVASIKSLYGSTLVVGNI